MIKNATALGSSLKITLFTCIFSLFTCFSLFAEDFKMTSNDNAFTMSVERVNGINVKVTLHLKNAGEYSHILIEKCSSENTEFSKCGYIDMKGRDASAGDVTKIDVYPIRPSLHSYYRVRLVTMEGVERVYPAVRLPADVR